MGEERIPMLRMIGSIKAARVSAVTASALALTSAAAVHAAPFTFNFAGTVTDSLGRGAPAGTPFTGSFTYDSQLPKPPDLNPDGSTIAEYGYLDQTQLGPPGGLTVHVDFGGLALAV